MKSLMVHPHNYTSIIILAGSLHMHCIQNKFHLQFADSRHQDKEAYDIYPIRRYF